MQYKEVPFRPLPNASLINDDNYISIHSMKYAYDLFALCCDWITATVNSYIFAHILQGCPAYSGAIVALLQTKSSFMMTSSKGNIIRVTGPLWGEFTGHRWIPLTKASDAEPCCFFDLCLNKRLSKQSWGWWFETPSRSLWRHRN